MTRKDNVQFSNCFLPLRRKYNQGNQFRSGLLEVFPEGHLSSIKVNLKLNGWTPAQIKIIQGLLCNGWSLSQSLNQVSFSIGRCLINIRKFS